MKKNMDSAIHDAEHSTESTASNAQLGPTIDVETHSLLLAAAQHDSDALRTLLRGASANVQHAETGFTPLHAAVAAFAPNHAGHTAPITEEGQIKAIETIRLLFENGAIWNDLDAAGDTPGDIAWRAGASKAYDLIVEAGVRAEILLNRLDEFEALEGDDDDEDVDDEDDDDEDVDDEDDDDDKKDRDGQAKTEEAKEQEETRDLSLSNRNYLTAPLTLTPSRLLDSSRNGVMMSWETNLMQRTAQLLLPEQSLSILNIGHGMGIIDTAIQSHSPSTHHIIEAHPDVLSALKSPSGFLVQHAAANIVLHEGTWQDILPTLVEQDVTFDAIFFDTFAEDYTAFRNFFEEFVVGLLNERGKWSFFHGLGADRRVCYDVYTKVVETDLFEAGFDVDWEIVEVPVNQKEWDGVARSYFNVEQYRLPLCKFVE